MTSAKIYLQTNVVDRLTRPIQQSSVDDDSSFINTQNQLQRNSFGGGGGNNNNAFDISYGGDRAVLDISSFMGSLQQTGI